MTASFENLGTPRSWLRTLGLALVCGALIGYIGPFGSWELPLWRRMFYCAAVAVIGATVLLPAMRLGLRLGDRRGLSRWWSGPLTALVLSGPFWLLFEVIAPVLWLGPPPGEGSAWSAYLEVLVFLGPLGVVSAMLKRRVEVAETLAPPTAPETAVLALQAEDHYVRTYTAQGSTLRLSRLADAIASLGDADGLQVHRSWWVARNAVRSGAVERRRLVLTLSNGLRVPVTRKAAPIVRRAGWL